MKKRRGASNPPKTSEDALSREFARYLAEVTQTFAKPMREGVRQQEQQLLQRQQQVQSDLEAYHGQILTETAAIRTSLRGGLMDYVGTMKEVRADTKKATATVAGVGTALGEIKSDTNSIKGKIHRVEQRVKEQTNSNQEGLGRVEQRVGERIEGSTHSLLRSLAQVEAKSENLTASVKTLRNVLIVFAVSQGIVLASLLILAVVILHWVRSPSL